MLGGVVFLGPIFRKNLRGSKILRFKFFLNVFFNILKTILIKKNIVFIFLYIYNFSFFIKKWLKNYLKISEFSPDLEKIGEGVRKIDPDLEKI